jgi:hypothetical protein
MTPDRRPSPTPADFVPIHVAAPAPDPRLVPSPVDPRAGAARPKRKLPAGIEPMLSLDDIATWVSRSRRWLERERSAGRVPRPDFHAGKSPRWHVATIRAWLETGGRS